MQGAPLSNWIAREGDGFTQLSSANVLAEEVAAAEANKPSDESINNALKFIGRAGCAVKCMACLQVTSSIKLYYYYYFRFSAFNIPFFFSILRGVGKYADQETSRTKLGSTMEQMTQ